MNTSESSSKFSTPEEVRQQMEGSFMARMRGWPDMLTGMENEPGALTELEKKALENLLPEINDVLTKPYKPNDKKVSLEELLNKIENLLN